MLKKPGTIRALVTGAIISSSFALIGTLTNFYITKKEPTLKYEILPVSYYKADSVRLSIVNIRIVNEGNKECENISFVTNFGETLKTTDYNFQKSSEAITIIKVIDSATRKAYYSIPYLNPKEQIVCSFLLNAIVERKNVVVDLRSKGNNGVEINNDENQITSAVFFGTMAMLTLAVGLIVFIIFHQRKVIRYQSYLQRIEHESLLMIFQKHQLDYEKEMEGIRNANIDWNARLGTIG